MIYIYQPNALDLLEAMEGADWRNTRDTVGLCSFEAFLERFRHKPAFRAHLWEEASEPLRQGLVIFGWMNDRRYNCSRIGELYLLELTYCQSKLERQPAYVLAQAKKLGFQTRFELPPSSQASP